MQVFSNLLANRFKEFGGTLLLKSEATKIIFSNEKISGIVLFDRECIKSNIVVSNIDAEMTFKKLLEDKNEVIRKKLNTLETSISAFAVYLGLKIDVGTLLKDKCAIWYFSTYDMDACYGDTMGNILQNNLNYIVCTFPSLHSLDLPKNRSTMELFMGATFKTKEFWHNNKGIIAEKAIRKAEEIIPGFSKYIDVKIIGTPQTFYRYTFNKNGAMYGWASTPSQIDKTVFPQKTHIKGLYLTGHWCTNGLGQGGISGVSYSGRHIAKIINNRLNRKNRYLLTKESK